MDKMIYIWLALINVIAFVLMGVDKYKAKRGKWRISEKALFIVAVVGGAVGMYVGMQVFRHKTKHHKFTLGIPVIIIVHIVLLVWLWF